jgi:hypothetical protein
MDLLYEAGQIGNITGTIIKAAMKHSDPDPEENDPSCKCNGNKK